MKYSRAGVDGCVTDGGGRGVSPHLRKGSREQALGNWVEVNERAWEGLGAGRVWGTGRILEGWEGFGRLGGWQIPPPAQSCPLALGRAPSPPPPPSGTRGTSRTERLRVAA